MSDSFLLLLDGFLALFGGIKLFQDCIFVESCPFVDLRIKSTDNASIVAILLKKRVLLLREVAQDSFIEVNRFLDNTVSLFLSSIDDLLNGLDYAACF